LTSGIAALDHQKQGDKLVVATTCVNGQKGVKTGKKGRATFDQKAAGFTADRIGDVNGDSSEA